MWVIAGIVFSSIAIFIFIGRRYAKDFLNHPIVLFIGLVSSVLGIISFAKDAFFSKDKPPSITYNYNDNSINDNSVIKYGNNQSSSNTTQAGTPANTKLPVAGTAAKTVSPKPAVTVLSGIHIVSSQNQPEDIATQQVSDAIQEKNGSNAPMPIIQGQLTITPSKPEDVNGQQTVSYKISLRLQFYKPDGITGCNLRVFDTTITGYADSPIDNIKKQALSQFCRELGSQLDKLLPACR